MTNRSEKLRAGLTAIWVKSLPHVREQLDTLERVASALRGGTATPDDLQAGEREAHRLAGSTGSFGFHDGTRLARELEHMLERPAGVDVQRVSEIVEELRKILDTEVLPE